MKIQMKSLLSFLMILCLGFQMNAQITQSPNLGIYNGAPPFTGFQEFTAIGESGGVPGPINNCDIYGFRAQTSIGNNVNVGIATRPGKLPNTVVRTPTVLWGVNKRLEFLINGLSTGQSNGSNLGCGKRIAYWYDSPSNNRVLTIYGSAFASSGTWQTSDRRLKRNILEIPNALEIVRQLNGVTYEYNKDGFPDLNLPANKQFGFIAQDVEAVVPSAVEDADTDEFDDTEFKMMQYTQIIPILTEAIKEQQVIIENQEDLLFDQLEINEQQTRVIASLEDRLTKLEAMLGGKGLQRSNAKEQINALQGVSLKQNRPNPFKGKTAIDYVIPSDMENAQLMIFDVSGKVLNSFALAPGSGQLTIDVNELTGGMYFYTIENNGQTIARQKMLVK